MIESAIEIRVLEPDEGMILTNGETYSKRVYLGVNDTPENWHEIPDIQTNDSVGQMQSGGRDNAPLLWG